MKNLMNTFNNVFSTNKEYSQDNFKIEEYIEKLKELGQYLPNRESYFLVQNTTQHKYEYVCDNFERVLGYPKSEMLSKGLPYHFSHYHPEDLQIWMKILEDLMTFTMTHVSIEDRIKCVYTWNYRIKNAKGKYINIQEQQTPLFFDEFDKPIIGVTCATVISNNKPQPLIAVAKILNNNNQYETLFYKNYSEAILTNALTNKEIDIVRLLSLSNSTKDIAQKLNISDSTVSTHRKNILQKLDFKSTAEIIQYCNANHIF